MVAALGTASAIVQALGGKQTKALQNFRQSIGGGGSAAKAGDSSAMGDLRSRIQEVMGVGTK